LCFAAELTRQRVRSKIGALDIRCARRNDARDKGALEKRCAWIIGARDVWCA
jgi:hypothetical protein